MKTVSPDILFQKARVQYDRKFPFVLYRKPDSGQLTGLFQDDKTTNEVIDFSETGYVFAPFSGNTILIIPEKGSELLSAKVNNATSASKEIAFTENETGKIQHLALVAKGIDAIQKQQFSKVVLSRKEDCKLQGFDIEKTFKALLALYPSAFAYCWFHPETGLWLGAFSEQLLKVTNNELHTMSVAGTQKWHDGMITWHEKEKEEQQIVTDFIVQNLQAFSAAISVSQPYNLKAGNIVHIKTDVKAKLEKDVRLSEIISVLHPTPAVCGMPKDNARKFILENELYNREFYSGFHGELNKDFLSGESQTDLYVNLRCMKIRDSQASLFVGGGITKDSVPEKEWTETVNKALTMKKVLAQNNVL